MRITTRLRIIAAVTIAALVVLAPVLVRAFNEFRSAKSEYVLVGLIKDAFFASDSLRNQYLLYREERVQQQWERTKDETDALLHQAMLQFHGEHDQQILQRLHRNAEERAEIFHRIVGNSAALSKNVGNRHIFEELDRRLASQQMLKAVAFRDMASAMQEASAARVEQTYQYLAISIGLFALMIALGTILTSMQISRLIRRRLAPLHAGARIIADGDLAYRIPSDGADEFAELAVSFNDMTARLLAFTEQLEAEIRTRKQSEERISELNRNFVSFLENTSDFIYFKDHDSRLRFCSQVMANITGHASWRDMIGKHDFEIFPQETAQIYYDEELPVFGTGKALLNKIDPYFDVSGNKGWVSTSKWPLLDDDGKVVGLFGISRDITEQKTSADALEVALSRLQKITSRVPGIIVIQIRLRPDGSYSVPYASEALRDLYRVSPDDVRDDAAPILASIHPDDLPAFLASIDESGRNLTPWLHEYRLKFAGEPDICLTANAIPQREADGSLLWCGFVTDITEHKRSQEKLQLVANVFTHAREGIMITAADGTIIDANDAFTRITSYQLDEVLGHTPRILSSGRQDREFYASMWDDLINKGHWYGEVWNRRKNGEVYAVMQTISAVRDGQGRAQQFVSLFSDITALKAHERQLEHVAHYDALTGLPNRVLLADRLQQAMAQAQRRGRHLMVAYLDLDGFKAVNDHHGHEAGDQLLVVVAGRMSQSLREGDTLARIGGDEFIAVLLDLAEIQASVPMLGRLLGAAAEPVRVGALVLHVSASLGVTFYPQAEEVDADQLFRQADQAMYQAKLAGKNRYHLFDTEQDRKVRGHHESLDRIRCALAMQEFVLHYQPKVNMRTGKVIGAEALIRWQHPERGLVLPAVFLPVIENHPLAVELGEWVIDRALTQMEVWRAAGLNLPVSVNVGARQLQQADFVERLRVLLAAHPGIMPRCLELEVLETSALEDLARISRVVQVCREIGVAFALDDFGTGYSSLTYMKRLSVALLKIDQSFIRGMLNDPDDLAIVQSVLGLATAFRRQVVAEGVETVEHGEMLLQFGCELAQGYGIARPMPAAELPDWATAWRSDPRWLDVAPVGRKDLARIFACVEFRAWAMAFELFLKHERDAPPLALHRSRLGAWLDAEPLSGRRAQPAVQAIAALHHQVQALADELLALEARGLSAEALVRLGELDRLRDALLAQLKNAVGARNGHVEGPAGQRQRVSG